VRCQLDEPVATSPWAACSGSPSQTSAETANLDHMSQLIFTTRQAKVRWLTIGDFQPDILLYLRNDARQGIVTTQG